MRISIMDLNESMILNEDIFNKYGSLILSKGTVISDKEMIKRLLAQQGIKRIGIVSLSNEEDNGFDIGSSGLNLDETPYSEETKQEIKKFVSDFLDISKEFENEIINVVSGNSTRGKVRDILERSLSTALTKNINVFQLLQKIKNMNDYTFIHCNSVALTTHALGNWLNVSREALKELTLAAMLFDIGKYQIPNEIISKPSKLTKDEMELVQHHVEYTLEMVRPYRLGTNIITAIKYHHERCDGSGYPSGLKSHEIPKMAKILAVADIFVALTSKRPYREKYTPFKAITIMEEEYMNKLDIEILTEFSKRVVSNYIGNAVCLSDGRIGEIIFINNYTPSKPLIKIKDTDELVDLSDRGNMELKIIEFL